jgi:hypothetical protein
LDKFYLFYDLSTGEILAKRPVGADAGSLDELSEPPITLDENHFALHVEGRPDRECSKELEIWDDCNSSSSVEIWQAVPLKRLNRIFGTDPAAAVEPTLVATQSLPDMPRPPKKCPEARDRTERCLSTYATVAELKAELLPTDEWFDESPETLFVQKVTSLSRLDDGLLAIQTESRVTLFDWRKGSNVAVLPGTEALLSPSGRYVAFSVDERGLGLFDRTSGTARVLTAPEFARFWPPVFDPKERLVATGGVSGFGYLWNVHTGRLERTMPKPTSLLRPTYSVNPIEIQGFSSNGAELTVRHAHGLRRFEVASGRELPELAEPRKEAGPRSASDAALASVCDRGECGFTLDGSFVVAGGGLVVARDTGRVVWPQSGFLRTRVPLEVKGTKIRLNASTRLDLNTARIEFDVPEAKVDEAVTAGSDQASLCTSRSGPVVAAGNYATRCDWKTTSLVLCEGAKELARRPNCTMPIALSPSGTSAVFREAQGLVWWEPRHGKERPWTPRLPENEKVDEVHLGPADEALVISHGKESGPYTARIFSENEPAWSLILPEQPQNVRFSSDPKRRNFRALLKNGLYTWELSTGKQIEYFEDVSSYKEYAEQNLLLLVHHDQIWFSRIVPRGELFSIHIDEDHRNAVVLTQDGRFELLGDRTQAAANLRCRLGHRVLPMAACAERFEWPGLLSEILSALRAVP